MKKITMICLALTMLIVGCKKVEVEFTFSPAQPRAGQAVKFSNKCSEGENWNWDFGDNVSSVLKNPSHTFKKPGTYLVTLVVDSAKYNTCSHSITVYDTVPTFVSSTDSIYHYTHVTFAANVYNPYGYNLKYDWQLPDNCKLVAGTLSSASIVVYFTDYSHSANDTKRVALTITQKDKTYPTINKDYRIYETKAPAIVMELTDHTVKRQRMINGYMEQPSTPSAEDVHMLDLSSDTMINFNGVTFYASKMQDIFPGIEVKRMQIDALAQKWYITTPNGLLVANINGQDRVVIDANATGAVFVDAIRNRLYWGNATGLQAMPLIKSKNNQFATTPEQYNQLSDINRIVVNNYYR